MSIPVCFIYYSPLPHPRVLYSVLKGFSSSTLVFSSPQKPASPLLKNLHLICFVLISIYSVPSSASALEDLTYS